MTKAQNNPLKAPSHLSRTARKWWKHVAETYELEQHHLHLLSQAAGCLDRAEEARLAIVKDGAYFLNRHGERKPHPALQVERDSRALFARLLRELDLDIEPPVDSSRPPALKRYVHA
jgi:phage terminase small subunit